MSPGSPCDNVNTICTKDHTCVGGICTSETFKVLEYGQECDTDGLQICTTYRSGKELTCRRNSKFNKNMCEYKDASLGDSDHINGKVTYESTQYCGNNTANTIGAVFNGGYTTCKAGYICFQNRCYDSQTHVCDFNGTDQCVNVLLYPRCTYGEYHDGDFICKKSTDFNNPFFIITTTASILIVLNIIGCFSGAEADDIELG